MASNEPTMYTHCDVVDDGGHKLGAVSDVVSDPTTLEPRWLVVDVGALKSSHYVPVTGSFRTADGRIVVPFTKESVKHAPKAHGAHVLTMEDDREMLEYYSLLN